MHEHALCGSEPAAARAIVSIKRQLPTKFPVFASLRPRHYAVHREFEPVVPGELIIEQGNTNDSCMVTRGESR